MQADLNRSVYFMGSFTNTYKQYSPTGVKSNWNTALSFLFAGGFYIFVTAVLLIYKYAVAPLLSLLD